MTDPSNPKARSQELAMVERHIAMGKRVIAQQEALVKRLQDKGVDNDQAKRTLDQFEQTQRMHLQHWDKLLQTSDKDGGEAER